MMPHNLVEGTIILDELLSPSSDYPEEAEGSPEMLITSHLRRPKFYAPIILKN
jgi:hypothetical protein